MQIDIHLYQPLHLPSVANCLAAKLNMITGVVCIRRPHVVATIPTRYMAMGVAHYCDFIQYLKPLNSLIMYKLGE